MEIKMVRMVILFLTIMCAISSCSDNMAGMGIGGNDGGNSAPDILTGQAFLENQEEYSGVQVELVDLALSLVTDSKGNFVLPDNMTEGQWTINASYPFFKSTSETFSVTGGLPEDKLEPLNLTQLVRFTVTCDKENYTQGETVNILLIAQNLTAEKVILASLTSPQIAFAVLKDGIIVYGDLLPGSDSTHSQVVLEPSESKVFEASWMINDATLTSGKYEIYGVVTTSQTHPNYFNPDSELKSKFNSTIYKKLTPSSIEIM